MNKLNKKGFTLIELIVVMAVIAILVLLAAPRFLGYTKDANVTAMKADAKMLSSIALVYNVEQEAWPIAADTDGATAGIQGVDKTDVDVAALITAEGITGELFAFDNDLIKNEYKSLKYPVAEYLLSEDGNVYHITPIVDRAGANHFTNK